VDIWRRDGLVRLGNERWDIDMELVRGKKKGIWKGELREGTARLTRRADVEITSWEESLGSAKCVGL
jgi:hypothetical protein